MFKYRFSIYLSIYLISIFVRPETSASTIVYNELFLTCNLSLENKKQNKMVAMLVPNSIMELLQVKNRILAMY